MGPSNFLPLALGLIIFSFLINSVLIVPFIDLLYKLRLTRRKEALKVLQKISENKKKIVVMGDMLELGKLEEKSHREIGQFIGKMKVDYLIGVGKASKILVAEAEKYLGRANCVWVSSYSGVISVLKPHLRGNSVVLIKGSRSISLDKVVSRLF